MTFDLELLKTVIGIISVAVGTASGVAALLVEFKDKETGKTTKWGRYALGGLAASFLIGTSNLWIDYTQKSREARETAAKSRESAEKTLQIVTDLSRTLNPLNDVRADFSISYPFDNPELAQYRQRLDEGVQALVPRLMDANHRMPQGVVGSVGAMDGTIEEVTISKDSPLFPDPKKERFAYTVLSNPSFQLLFFKSPVDPETILNVPGETPDIDMNFEEKESHGQVTVEYNLRTKKIRLIGFEIPSDVRYWRSSGEIVSVLDLPGSQMIVLAGHLLVSFTEREKRVEPDDVTVVLNVAERREWRFRGDKLKLYKTSSGTKLWAYTFPTSFVDLLLEVEAGKKSKEPAKNLH